MFCDAQAFEEEAAQYRDPVLQRCLPELVYASSNADGTTRSARGFVFPPFLVIERGMTLTDWVAKRRGPMEVRICLQICKFKLQSLRLYSMKGACTLSLPD